MVNLCTKATIIDKYFLFSILNVYINYYYKIPQQIILYPLVHYLNVG